MNIRLSIRYQIAILVTVIELVLSALIILTMSNLISSLGENARVLREHALIESIEKFSATHLFSEEFGELQAIADSFSNDPALDTVLIADRNKVIVASSDFASLGERFDVEVYEGWVVRDVTGVSTDLGIVALKFSRDQLADTILLVRFYSTGIAMVWVLISALVGLWAGRFITQRLEQLEDAAGAFGKENFNNFVEITGDDEISELGKAFNSMVERISQGRQESAQLLKELISSESRLAEAQRISGIGYWGQNLSTGETWWSPKFYEFLELDPAQQAPSFKKFIERVHKEDRNIIREKTELLMSSDWRVEGEIRLEVDGGEIKYLSLAGEAERDEDGIPIIISGTAIDITDKKRAELELERYAFIDQLTGLPNRRLLKDQINLAIQNQIRNPDEIFAVLFMDLDNFKDVNDSFGHNTGDNLIIEISSWLKDNIRSQDTIGRFGGDEIILLINRVKDPTEVINLIKRINDRLSQPFFVDNYELFTSVSIGIAFSHEPYQDADSPMRDADTAMYIAKKNSSENFVIFDQEMHTDIKTRMELQNSLYHALDRDEFRLAYQPIISLADQSLVGVEALIRWEHPTEGALSPDTFIPIAEETGLIIKIGKWVIEETCSQIAEWEKLKQLPEEFYVSINVSPFQILHSPITLELESALEKFQLSPSRIKIEITEVLLIGDYDKAALVLNQIKNIGVDISLDDFGTGYSSLNHFRSFPVSSIKIDKSFVHEFFRSKKRDQFFKAIVDLAHSMEVTVLVEGVETEEQRILLRDVGCDYCQGFLFSPALFKKEMTEYLEKKVTIVN